MTRAAEVLREFGERAGLAGLDFDARGQTTLRLASGRLFSVERGEASLLVSLARPLDTDPAVWLLRAWKRIYYERPAEWAVQVALRETDSASDLLALVRIPEDDFSLARLQQAADYLASWHDTLRD